MVFVHSDAGVHHDDNGLIGLSLKKRYTVLHDANVHNDRNEMGSKVPNMIRSSIFIICTLLVLPH